MRYSLGYPTGVGVAEWEKGWGLGTVKAHSSGPEVERGRCPNLDFAVDEDILCRGVAGNEIRSLNDRI